MNIDAHIAELKRIDEEFQVWLKQKSYYGPPKFIFELYEDFSKDTGNHFIPVELRNYQFDPVVYKQNMNRNEIIINKYLPNYKEYMIFVLVESYNGKTWNLVLLTSYDGAEFYYDAILRDLQYNEVVYFSLKCDISIKAHVETENQR